MVPTERTWDRTEVERLVETYSDLILRLSYSYLKSTEDAKDICQTVFLKLLEKPRTFASPEHERAWIIRTAANICKDVLKSHWRRTTVDMDAAGDVPAPQAEEGSLLAAVGLLPPKYRAVIYLYYYEGYAAKEIAQMLGENPATVSTRLNRGRAKLKTMLESEGMA
ncbi:MAG TPA: sigma-70 family RNA polymerase sigma factor [Candidatus Flavonifractor intestinipullorum]|uniref:Sigma-70 family RNA polymerase sigma factor n=1 Tax=Candidatus Flavonifractor intestinipullorum TaxID=2838587 RepID=A0A9D2MBU2_9FIRM|nr:sigma-70 family RNA polymerase sigma factor [Candidatus Flavonifractor intestinipullorum]